MSLVAIAGDHATTTTLALAAAWPVSDDLLVIEADPRGGSLAAWLDIPLAPSLSAVVTRATGGEWSVIERLSRLTPSGLRVIPAPVRAVEATRAIAEAADSIFPTLASLASPVVVADTGVLRRDSVAPERVASHPWSRSRHSPSSCTARRSSRHGPRRSGSSVSRSASSSSPRLGSRPRSP